MVAKRWGLPAEVTLTLPVQYLLAAVSAVAWTRVSALLLAIVFLLWWWPAALFIPAVWRGHLDPSGAMRIMWRSVPLVSLLFAAAYADGRGPQFPHAAFLVAIATAYVFVAAPAWRAVRVLRSQWLWVTGSVGAAGGMFVDLRYFGIPNVLSWHALSFGVFGVVAVMAVHAVRDRYCREPPPPRGAGEAPGARYALGGPPAELRGAWAVLLQVLAASGRAVTVEIDASASLPAEAPGEVRAAHRVLVAAGGPGWVRADLAVPEEREAAALVGPYAARAVLLDAANQVLATTSDHGQTLWARLAPSEREALVRLLGRRGAVVVMETVA